MNINIPDKFYKLFVLIGILLVGYSYYQMDREERIYFEKIDGYNKVQDSLAIAVFIRNYKLNEIKRKADRISETYCVDNPLVEMDSILKFSKKLNGTKEELLVSDSIDVLWENFQVHKFKIELLKKREEIESKQLEDAKKLKSSYFKIYKVLQESGFYLLFIGMFLWVIDQPWINAKSKESKKQFEKIYSFCQSCGMKFSPIRAYGTEKNKDSNYSFCKNCFKDGKFTNKELTHEEVITSARETTKHKNWFYRKLLGNRLSKLERWKQNEY